MTDREHPSTQCRDYRICGREIEGNPADGSCILHSKDPAKDVRAFAEALALHRERHGDNFTWFVFPEDADNFVMKRFHEGADFTRATFTGDISFFEARFRKTVCFSLAKFNKRAHFGGVRFFSDFLGFSGATFSGGAHFGGAVFSGDVHFDGVTFSEGANFDGVTFSGSVNFVGATFSGRTLFSRQPGAAQTGRIFAGTTVDFRQVVINPPDAITFLGADFTTCQFLDTDLRKAQLVDIKWPRKGRRLVVYDEILSVATRERDRDGDRDGDMQSALQQFEQMRREYRQGIEQLDREFRQNDETDSVATGDGDGDRDGDIQPWPQLERLYRELKQNYEDRRDYERAGDFHYGEKEMRRKNPDTALGLRLFLTLYWLFSGYGERYLRPLLWAGVLFVGATIGYMWYGLCPPAGGPKLACDGPKLALTSVWGWLQGAYYSFRVMTLLKPVDLVPVGCAHVINTFQTLLGPLFLGLFALALRQRLKR